MFSLTTSEKQWLKSSHPTLRILEKASVSISGQLHFDMVFDPTKSLYIYHPNGEFTSSPNRIIDKYEIEVLFEESLLVPKVRETGGRIVNVAKSLGKQLVDLHLMAEDGSCCMCVPMRVSAYLPNGLNLPDLFNNLVTPFFYAQGYFEKNHTWPWGEYSHGALGLLEWYEDFHGSGNGNEPHSVLLRLVSSPQWSRYRNLLETASNIQGHQECICGSRRRFRDCHGLAFRGLWKLKKDLGPRLISATMKTLKN
jgi:hypothetical protein